MPSTLRFLLGFSFTSLSLTGCMDNGLYACNDKLELGITTPAPNAIFAQGFGLTVNANVRSTCGSDLKENGFFALTSTEEGELGGTWDIEDGKLAFEMDAILRLGEHTLTLRGVTSEGSAGEDTVVISVIENDPPTVSLTNPGPDGADFESGEAVRIQGSVADNAEPLEGLELRWTINGEFFDGPPHPDADGEFDFEADVAGGCHSLEVTVIDAVGQEASDSGDFVLWEESADLEAYLWWSDEDGDGWGIPEGETLACDAPEGSVAFTVEQDCDDLNDEIHPGHADYCGDGLDSDCDPVTPTGCYPLGEIGSEFAQASLQGGTLKLSQAGDVNDDGYDDFAVAMTDQKTHLVFGPMIGELSANIHVESEKTTVHQYLAGDLGVGMHGGKDVDGDGISDLLLGNPDWTWACSSKSNSASGRAYLLKGGSTLESGVIEDWLTDASSLDSGEALSLQTDFINGCDSYLSQTGASVEILDDMDGDGKPDIAIGATIDDTSTAGAVYVVLSSQLAILQNGDTLEDIAHLRLSGTSEKDHLGAALASGDFDGDGLSDLAISTNPEAVSDPGTVYIVFAADLPIAPAQMEIQSLSGLIFTGANANDDLGTDIAGVGDLDGDGDDELLISAPGAESGRGVAYLVPGFYEVFGNYMIEDSFSTTVTPNATSAVRLVGGLTDFVRSVGGVGDLNNDGEMDFLIGAPGHSNGVFAQSGAAYVLYGGDAFWGDWWDPQSGVARDDVDLEGSAQKKQKTAKIASSVAGEELGWDVAWGGDLNGDGIDDIVIGPLHESGHVRVFFGGGT